MGSNHGNGRDRGPKRRRGLDKRRALPALEGLEVRSLMSIGDVNPVQPLSNNLADVKQGPLARAGSQLLNLYQEYTAFLNLRDQGQFRPSQGNILRVRGDKVHIDVSGVGNLANFQASLHNVGMEIDAVDATRRIVNGWLPIAQLPTVARNPQVSGIQPVFKPFTNVGSSGNQGDLVLRADAARTQSNVNGAGVKVGVLSDSIGRFDNPAVAGIGLAESVTTGDLPANVQIIQDENVGGNNSDEGRAMLEQIFDIAPGASLAFATAFEGGEIGFANNIRALAQAGSRVIVDDVGYFAEPMFQDGIIAQAITDVVNNFNVSYFSSAGNSSDSGYQSTFRGTNDTVGGITGRFMDFDPGAGTLTALPITLRPGGAGAPVTFHWDNPYYVTNGVTSDLDIIFLDANGAAVARSQTNNILQGTPNEVITVPAGAASVAFLVNAGSPDVGRVSMIALGDAFAVDQRFASAGGTTYASSFGHPNAAEAINVGAVPWWAAPPFTTTNNPLRPEVFSSFGPNVTIFNPDGSRKGAAETRLKPDVSGPDGVDTSFFIPGLLLSTVNPPPRTGPATATELDGNALPNFFGTSSSAPNLAAVAALMKQLAPGVSQRDIRNAMISTALPLNGTPKGQWDVQGGFGLVQADAALQAIDTLRVVTATPGVGATLTTSPNALIVIFSRPIAAGSLQPTDLTFTNTPPGVGVVVGQPVLLNPTSVSFPLTFVTQPGQKANGAFTYLLNDGSILSTDGRQLTAFAGSFALADVTAPKVANTTFLGRTVIVQFNEAMRPDTVNAGTVVLYRIVGGALERVSTKPGAVVTYDAANNRAIIDLTQVAQNDLPSGTYVVQVLDLVTDLVGNRLDGEFNGPPPGGNGGVFPSGDNKPVPNEDNDNDNFIQIVPNQILRAPQFQGVGLDQTSGPLTTNPRVFGTLYNRQAIEIYFSQPMNAATINSANIFLLRSTDGGLTFPTRVPIPATAITYDNIASRAVINLAGLTAAQLPPGDTYALAVTDAVTDTQGDRLDGEFRTSSTSSPINRLSLFPSGDQKVGGAEQTDGDFFVQIIPDLATSGPARFTRFDSGIVGDQNTNVTRPVITGTVSNAFPGAVGGLQVVAQFNAMHGGVFNLNTGTGGRGFVGTPDVVTTTDSQGRFTIPVPTDLPDGFNTVRIVVVGQSDAPPLPGLSTRIDSSFRIDTTRPTVTTSVANGSLLSGLTSLSLDVVDPILPTSIFDPLVVPTQLSLPALDPSTANNISNYTLLNLGADGVRGGTGANADQDLSRFIVGASFVSTTVRTQVGQPYTGRVDLSFAPGLPAGRYLLIGRRPQPGFAGITDAAGNPIDGDPSQPGAQDFELAVQIQSQPVFITSVKAISPLDDGTVLNINDPSTFVASDPRSFFELALPGITPRATAAPNTFFIDFSAPLPNRDYSNSVQLIRSANGAGVQGDGDFGVDNSFTSGTGYTRVANVTVVRDPSNFSRLLVRLPAGTSLPADSYRLFVPNTGPDAIFDVFGNLLDGEFLGDRDGKGGFETLLPNGQYRAGLSGDLIPGGSFQTGYVVVPNGNVIYARPDYVDSPFLTSDDPDGSLAKPFPSLAPEAIPSAANGFDANSVLNFGTNFDPTLDRNQNGRFDRSALYAAQVASARGPVVVVAVAGARQRDPVTGVTTQETFVLAAPAGGTDPLRNNASASVPFNTTLVFDAGSALKLQNASLFVQNQGSAFQARGGFLPEERVNFTSFSDDTVGGDTNDDGAPGRGGNTPGGGDWGGIVFRNYDQSGRTNLVPFPVDGRLKGPGTSDARSGADDAMSEINFSRIRFGGGPVPRTSGQSDGPVTMFNSRPAVTNTLISDSRATAVTGTIGAITLDFDSLREDELTRGPLIRRVDVVNNSINGIFVRATLSGQARQTDAIRYPNNPASKGGTRNFTVDDPLPHILTTRLVIGEQEQVTTGGQTTSVTNRLYVQPGMMFKMPVGAAIDIVTPGASVNVGDRTYINQFDLNPNFAPTDANYRNNTTGDAEVIFTSYFDDTATTVFRDPNTGLPTTIVPAIDTDNGGGLFQPVEGNVPASARWGGLAFTSGAVAVLDEAEFRYGGGSVNIPSGTIGQRDVLAFQVPFGFGFTQNYTGFSKTIVGALGTRAKVTNNDFFDNQQAPIEIDPNGLLAADPLRPLLSGNPFFRNNIMQRNGLNGMEVRGDNTNRDGLFFFNYPANVNVDTLWDDTDLTYVLRTMLSLEGVNGFGFSNDFPEPTTGFTNELKPFVSLTVQSSLPDTLLADGSRIARPGESALVKFLNPALPIIGDGLSGFPAGNNQSDTLGGAGFIVGIDDGVDPPTDVLVDPGAFSQLRFVGIGGNETTGQQRVPVILTSLRDETVGRTVRGIEMFETVSGNTTAPAAGDGGVIAFGALSLSDYNLYDPRNGSIIDNVDARFLTRIEVQGGGFVYRETGGTTTFDKPGTTPATQFNTQQALTISNSNLSNFSQVGLVAHGAGVDAIQLLVDPLTGNVLPPANRTPTGVTAGRGEGILLNFVNNVIANMPVGVRMATDTTNNAGGVSPNQALFLHNTFAGNPIAIDLFAPNFDTTNSLAHNYIVAMNNIFDGATTAAVRVAGQAYSSQGQFNLFSGNSVPVVLLGAGTGNFFANNNPITGSALFKDPVNGDYSLQPGSDAIDRSLSELGEVEIGRALRPISTQLLNASGGIRNTNDRNPFGGLGFGTAGDIITLPGFPDRVFEDQFIPALPGTPGAVPGPATVPGAFHYLPIGGDRDQNGFIRVDDPTNPRIGAGSRPFYDIGALERRIIIPPKVIDVQAIFADPSSPTGIRSEDFYIEGGVAGANTAPLSLRVRFDNRLDPNTINNRTIVLQAAGGDGIFGNGNNSSDRTIDLSGKLTYDAATQTVIIDLSGILLSLGNDQFRLTLFGNGQDVLRDPQGNALDAENTVGAVPTGAQLPLPSGNGTPGGNFFLTFQIDTQPSSIASGTVRLDASSDTGRAGDAITNSNRPSFSGRIQDPGAPAGSLVGQTVILDYAGADGRFGTADDQLNIGTALTTAGGNFLVTVGTDGASTGLVPAGVALPDTQVNVGPDGFLGPNPATGQVDDDLLTYGLARVRVVDQSGNVSDPNAVPGLVRFDVDTRGPQITATSPLPGAGVTAAGGVVPIVLIVNENVDISTVNASTIQVRRAGGDGTFGNANDVPLTIAGGIQVNPLKNAQGAVEVRFSVTGATANDIYRATILSGPSGVRDWAGNPIDGDANGSAAGDFNLDFIVFDTSNPRRILFVDDDATPNPAATGRRSDPISSIMGETLPGTDGKLGTADDVIVPGAMQLAGVGDTIAVLPGTYAESVVLKSLVRLVSASISSSDGNFIPGQALQTVIRPPAATIGGATVGVSATNLLSLPNFATELAGFTIAIPLVGNPNTGSINGNSFGVLLTNSNVLVNRNYVINAGYGIVVGLGGVGAQTPTIESNGLIGNNHGVLINAANAISFANSRVTRVANNTFAYNGVAGLLTINSPGFSTAVLADVSNNIFAQNFSGSTSRSGAAIYAASPTILNLRGNLFSNNGVSQNSPADDVVGRVGGAFDPSRLSTTPDANGNFVGIPGFANPRDPRPTPQGQGPAVFFLDANFDLTTASDAIDNAVTTPAPAALDFRLRGRVDIPNRGRPGFGPADIGAFERDGTGGIAGVGGSGTVQSATLSSPTDFPNGGAATLGLSTLSTASVRTPSSQSINVRFSQPVDRASVQPTDLVLTGDLDGVNPAHASSLSWIDDQTVAFNLAGAFGNGTVQVEVPEGTVLGRDGKPLQGYNTTINVGTKPTTPAAAVAVAAAIPPTQAIAPAPALTPAPAPAPLTKAQLARQRRQAAWARLMARRVRA